MKGIGGLQWLDPGGHSFLTIHRKLTNLVTQSCLSQWNYEPCLGGPPKMDGSWWKVLTKHGPLEKGMANHFSILALRTPWTVWKGKKIDTKRWTPQVGRCPVCYWRSVRNNSRKNEEMESKQKQPQLSKWLVMEVKSNAIKNNIA